MLLVSGVLAALIERGVSGKGQVVDAAMIDGAALLMAAPGASQEVAKRATKRAAKEATESAAKSAAEDAAKKAVKKAVAPDAIDLNTASPEQLAKLGLDEETAKKVIAARPFTGLEDAKLTAAIPADKLKALEGKITVKPPPAPAQ